MKNFTRLALAMALMFMPTLASAQQNVTVQFNGTEFSTSVSGYVGSGGAFKFTPTPLVPVAPPVLFTDFLAFCIDPTRTISVAGNYTYQYFSFAAFTAQNWGNSNLSDQSLSDLNYMASQAASYDMTAPFTGNNPIQKNIWDTFTNGVASANFAGDFSQDWGVLANGKNQTMLVRVNRPDLSTTVPEPGTYALMTAGLIGLFGVVRRRKTHA